MLSRCCGRVGSKSEYILCPSMLNTNKGITFLPNFFCYLHFPVFISHKIKNFEFWNGPSDFNMICYSKFVLNYTHKIEKVWLKYFFRVSIDFVIPDINKNAAIYILLKKSIQPISIFDVIFPDSNTNLKFKMRSKMFHFWVFKKFELITKN